MIRQIQDRVFREAAERAAKKVFLPENVKNAYNISIQSGKIIITPKQAISSQQ